MKKSLQLLFLLYIAFFLAMLTLKGFDKLFSNQEAPSSPPVAHEQSAATEDKSPEPVPKQVQTQPTKNTNTFIFELPREESMHRTIYVACRNEREKLCSSAQNMDDLEDCLLDHKSSLSERCDQLITALQMGYAPCKADLEKFCPKSKTYNSQAIACLKTNKEKLSKICQPLVEI